MAGKTFQDRELAAKVRTLALEELAKVLKRKKGKLYEAVLIRLAGSVLPRLNEHSGPEGAPIPIMSFEESSDERALRAKKLLYVSSDDSNDEDKNAF